MIDTHAHLNFKAFASTLDTIIEQFHAVGVTTAIVPGTDNKTSVRAVEIAQNHPGIYAAVGIHPHHVFQEMEKDIDQEIDFTKKLAVITALLTKSRVVAVGEIGLDRHIYKNTKYSNYQINDQFMVAQKEFFTRQLQLAVEYKKSIIMHNRETEEEILDILTENWDPFFNGRVVFHCCEPSRKLLQFAIKNSLFIGVDGDVTYSLVKQKFIQYVPPKLLVLETDSPFLLPEPARSEKKFPNTPKNLPAIARFVALIRGEAEVDFVKQVNENASRLFGIEV